VGHSFLFSESVLYWSSLLSLYYEWKFRSYTNNYNLEFRSRKASSFIFDDFAGQDQVLENLKVLSSCQSKKWSLIILFFMVLRTWKNYFVIYC
jgi:hypothetical protein